MSGRSGFTTPCRKTTAPVPPLRALDTSLRLPGVYPAQGDTALLLECLLRERLQAGVEVLDLGTGCGSLALAAARRGARVVAVDVSWHALFCAWLNARRQGCRVRLRHGDLTAPVADERFDLVVSNPPYVPARRAAAPRHGIARAWDAGPDGRLVLDRFCAQAPHVLRPGGVLLVVQSAIADVAATLSALARGGVVARVTARRRQPFGPVMKARAGWFEQCGLITPGQRDEDLVVIRGVRAG
ncbi:MULTISPECIES: HemK2/MTQ2 family protein methyltransferase [Kitasatospora]|uniref:Methyltransferase n=1 Tax=Kitasatospora cystarginea TaxID=58350 RepID=A0ABP5S0M9_9ACTN